VDHAKRAIVEPQRQLSVQETKAKVGDYFNCPLVEPFAEGSPENALGNDSKGKR
jgi:hypothetical protein